MKYGAIILAFALWTVAAVFGGYKLRDYRALAAAQTAQAAAQAARADAVTDARADDSQSAQSAAQTEQARIDRTNDQDKHAAVLRQDVITYARTHHAPATAGTTCTRGNADAEFMRIWSAANAGAFGDPAEPVDSANPAASTSSATASQVGQ